MSAGDIVLALNAGSSSLKAAVFEGDRRILRCVVEALGARTRVRAEGPGGDVLGGGRHSASRSRWPDWWSL